MGVLPARSPVMTPVIVIPHKGPLCRRVCYHRRFADVAAYFTPATDLFLPAPTDSYS